MDERLVVERLGADSRDEAVEVLCEAFFDYPVFRYALKDAGESYSRGLDVLIGHVTDARLLQGYPVLGIRRGDRLLAAASLNPPLPGPKLPEITERWQRLHEQTSEAAIRRFEAFGAASQALAPEGQYWYLGMIGVRPEAQGLGLGGALLSRIAEMSEADADSSGVLLTTETPDNVSYYEGHGYEVVGADQVEELRTWTLLRRDRA